MRYCSFEEKQKKKNLMAFSSEGASLAPVPRPVQSFGAVEAGSCQVRSSGEDIAISESFGGGVRPGTQMLRVPYSHSSSSSPLGSARKPRPGRRVGHHNVIKVSPLIRGPVTTAVFLLFTSAYPSLIDHDLECRSRPLALIAIWAVFERLNEKLRLDK
jgi:hypothetical protein